MKRTTGLALGIALLLSSTAAFAGTIFTVTPLVADKGSKAPNIDPQLKNPWGISQFPGGNLWVSDNRNGLSTLYDPSTGAKNGLVVTIPGGKPTGQVAMPGGHGFTVGNGTKSGESVFIFASETGKISGWAPSVDSANAFVGFDIGAGNRKEDESEHYTGLAWDPASNRLFAADVSRDKVDIIDNAWHLVSSFTDPDLPKGYGPFNVALLGGKLYVTFALLRKDGEEVQEGAGLGYVSVFNTDGSFVKRLVSNGPLDAPWGLILGPGNFGDFAGKLLVGNFGEGHVNAFDPDSGTLVGTLKAGKKDFQAEDLWQLDDTGNGSITFSAGLKHEKHGLIGLITPKQ
jgi:uncharacterized protein (TIGR03118 family)